MGNFESYTRRTKMTRDVRRSLLLPLLLSHTAEETEEDGEWFMAFAYRVKKRRTYRVLFAHTYPPPTKKRF